MCMATFDFVWVYVRHVSEFSNHLRAIYLRHASVNTPRFKTMCVASDGMRNNDGRTKRCLRQDHDNIICKCIAYNV